MFNSYRAFCPKCMTHQMATEEDDGSLECDVCGHCFNAPEIAPGHARVSIGKAD